MAKKTENVRKCSCCGEEVKEKDVIICPVCSQKGCLKCMPDGNDKPCPECVMEEALPEDSEDEDAGFEDDDEFDEDDDDCDCDCDDCDGCNGEEIDD